MEDNQQHTPQAEELQGNVDPEAKASGDSLPTDGDTPADDDSQPAGEEAPATPSEEERLSAEVAEWKDKYVRLHAEFDNFRRRTAREKLEMISQANADLLKDLLPVLDDLERAAGSFQQTEDVQVLGQGVQLVENKMRQVLEKKGVKSFESQGTQFDPEMHEAITNIPAPNESARGTVLDVIEKGYRLQDKVIRFAKVVIGA